MRTSYPPVFDINGNCLALNYKVKVMKNTL